jgi:subfamily B ATP-binding cassette protein MsbA
MSKPEKILVASCIRRPALNNWTPLINLARGQLWALPILIFLGLAGTAAEGIGLGLLVFLLQLMLGASGTAIGGGGMLESVFKIAFSMVGENIVVVSIVTVGLIVTKSLLIAGYSCLSSSINAAINDRLRRLVFDRLMQAEYSFVNAREYGHYQNLITSESMRVTEAVWTVFQILVSLCAIVVFTTMLLLISWQLVLVVAIGTALASLITGLLAKKANSLGDVLSDAYSNLASRVSTVLGGMRVVRAFGRERDETERFSRESQRVRRSFVQLQYLKAATGPLSEGLYLTVFVGIVIASAAMQTPLASVITFVVILSRLHPQVKNLDWSRVQLAGYRPAVARIADFLEHPLAPAAQSGWRRFEGFKAGIRFSNVTFSYFGESRLTLRRVSFEIARGRTTAIVGSSGAGKSTITNLLLRLYHPTSGSITADGVGIAEFELASWRKHIAVAGQDADLLDGTILENIRYGKPSADLTEIEEAARKAGILDFVLSLPDSWETFVGERGLRLSGGQRQRLSLARALLRNAELLILDEATNALDSLLEGEIQAAVDELAGKTTIVIIAHRLSTVVKADKVIVLRDGAVAEQGSPAELFAQSNGHFGRLYGAQSAGAGIAAESRVLVPGISRK